MSSGAVTYQPVTGTLLMVGAGGVRVTTMRFVLRAGAVVALVLACSCHLLLVARRIPVEEV